MPRKGGTSVPDVACRPTATGMFIYDVEDALVLTEGMFQGTFQPTARRVFESERESLIVSGNVFLYPRKSSGISRWTDGKNWSPSRCDGNFLYYRQLEAAPKPDRPVKKDMSKKDMETLNTPGNWLSWTPEFLQKYMAADLYGALVEDQANDLGKGYGFKTTDDCLVKRCIPIVHGGLEYQLVSYYTVKDIATCALVRPTEHHLLQGVSPRQSLFDGFVQAGTYKDKVYRRDLRFRATALLQANGDIVQAPQVQLASQRTNPLEMALARMKGQATIDQATVDQATVDQPTMAAGEAVVAQQEQAAPVYEDQPAQEQAAPAYRSQAMTTYPGSARSVPWGLAMVVAPQYPALHAYQSMAGPAHDWQGQFAAGHQRQQQQNQAAAGATPGAFHPTNSNFFDLDAMDYGINTMGSGNFAAFPVASLGTNGPSTGRPLIIDPRLMVPGPSVPAVSVPADNVPADDMAYDDSAFINYPDDDNMDLDFAGMVSLAVDASRR